MAWYPERLPDFPWDSLAPYAKQAAGHPGGIVDLSVGTPVDPTPAVAQEALAAASDAPGYPPTYGSSALRSAIATHYARRRGVVLDPDGVLPTIGSKEMVALLPSLLGLGEGDLVIHPEAAYPTYDVGARLCGATPVPCDDPTTVDPSVADRVRLVWLNSPANPTGTVLDTAALARIVTWARARGAIVVADECYAELAWTPPYDDAGVPSVLDRAVSGLDHTGVLALYSLSKQSNLAGYRAAWAAGDVALIQRLLAVRKHLGMMMPEPVQAAIGAVLEDDEHVEAQRARYARRRAVLLAALGRAGYLVDGSQAGLYLWTRYCDGRDCWQMVADLAALGILVAPGEFYGAGGRHHVRIALTGTDERIDAACARLTGQ